MKKLENSALGAIYEFLGSPPLSIGQVKSDEVVTLDSMAGSEGTILDMGDRPERVSPVMWNRVLTSEEILSFRANPYQIFDAANPLAKGLVKAESSGGEFGEV